MRMPLFAAAAMLAALWPAIVQADPELFVTFEGVNISGNNVFKAAVAPDPALFHETVEGPGSSLAVELAFAVTGSTIQNIQINNADWMYDNPGNNPFTNSVTFGTWISPTNDQAFTSWGSEIFKSGDPVELFTMETLGSVLTTVDYGVAASGDEIEGATIAQSGENFTTGGLTLFEMMTSGTGAGGGSGGSGIVYFHGYTGSVTSPEPTAVSLAAAALAAGMFILSRRGR